MRVLDKLSSDRKTDERTLAFLELLTEPKMYVPPIHTRSKSVLTLNTRSGKLMRVFHTGVCPCPCLIMYQL